MPDAGSSPALENGTNGGERTEGRKLANGLDPAEMGRRSGEARRAAAARRQEAPEPPANGDEPDEVGTLRQIIRRQEQIALGKVRGSTATQETQAAKAVAELRAQLRALEEAQAAATYDLRSLSDRLVLVDWLVHLAPADVQEATTLVTEAWARRDEG